MTPLPYRKRASQGFWKSCSKEKLEETAKKAGLIIVQDIFRTFELKIDCNSATYFLTTILARYAKWYKCEHYIQDSTEIFHMRHNLEKSGAFIWLKYCQIS